MTTLDAAEEILSGAGKPLHINDITKRMLESGLWQTDAKKPRYALSATFTVHINKRGNQSRIRRVRPGVYGLNDGSLVVGSSESNDTAPATPKLTLADAAERILRQNNGQRLHYKEISRRIITDFHGNNKP